MEIEVLSKTNNHISNLGNGLSTDRPFINANTCESTYEEISEQHIIPVFVKDNEPLISHADFIQVVSDLSEDIFHEERILRPAVRLSHPVKGRIPEAKNKSAIELLENEKTLYYERMAFVIEIPTITGLVGGNTLNLTIGGVKAYNLDNLYTKKGADEHFKVFIGFQNKVCTNLCVWTDGYKGDLKVGSIGQLKTSVKALIEGYNQDNHLYHLNRLQEYSITEEQFAHLIGRCRMYNHLPIDLKNEIPSLMLGDSQIGAVVKDYYNDNSFCRDTTGEINLWKLYNLFTGVNKSSYIDTLLDRSVNAYNFIEQVRLNLEQRSTSWYLN